MALRGKLAFTSDEDLQRAVDEYFEARSVTIEVDDGGEVTVKTKHLPVTFTGLALHLDVTTETLRNYMARDGFGPIITRAKMRIEEYYEIQLMTKSASRGAAFALSVNFGWGQQGGGVEAGEGKVAVIKPPVEVGDAAQFVEYDPGDELAQEGEEGDSASTPLAIDHD